jgi:hypothetical protein
MPIRGIDHEHRVLVRAPVDPPHGLDKPDDPSSADDLPVRSTATSAVWLASLRLEPSPLARSIPMTSIATL